MSESLKLIKLFVEENKGLVFLYFFANIFSLFLETILLSQILSNIFAKLTMKKNDKELAKLFMMYVILFVVTKTGFAIRNYVYDLIIPKFNKFVKVYLYNSIIDRYQIDYVEPNLGYILYNFQNLPSSFNRIIIEMLQEYIPNTIAVIICISYLLYVNRTIGIVTMITLIFVIFVIIYRCYNNVKLSIEEHDLTQYDNEFVQDKLSNLFNIYTSGTTEVEKIEYEKLEDKLSTSTYDNYTYSTVTSMILEFSSIVVIIIAFYVIYKDKNISQNAVLIIIVLTYYINYLGKTSNNLVSIVDIIGYIKQAEIFLKELEVPQNSQSPSSPSSPQQNLFKNSQSVSSIKQLDFYGPIVFNNVNYAYTTNNDKVQLFDNVSFIIEPGKKIAIYGRSGSGKTTLIKLLLGFYTLDSGSISINSVNIKDIDVDYLRKNISIVNQNNKLFDATVLENMKYGTQISTDELMSMLNNLGILGSGIFENLKDGLNTSVTVGGSNLSGGQKQIIGIVRALVKPCSIMLFDEPTSALDSNTKRIVLEIIKKINGRTVIIISHDKDISKYVDETFTLENGKFQK